MCTHVEWSLRRWGPSVRLSSCLQCSALWQRFSRLDRKSQQKSIAYVQRACTLVLFSSSKTGCAFVCRKVLQRMKGSVGLVVGIRRPSNNLIATCRPAGWVEPATFWSLLVVFVTVHCYGTKSSCTANIDIA